MTETTLHDTPVTVKNLAASFDQIKAVGALPISATAKLIGIAILATGCRSAAELSTATGIPKSTVYRAQTEFYENAGDLILTVPTILTPLTGENLTVLTDEKETEKPVSLVSPVRISEPEPSCARDITPRATKELPSEVLQSKNNNTPLLRRPPPQKKSTGVRGTRLPNDWQLPEDWRQWVLVNCPCSSPAAVEREAMIFANYWQSLAGQKATKVDWRKTWLNWCLKTFASGPVRERRDSNGLTAKQLAGRAALAHIEARIASYNS
jgi:hypothetical protein